MATTSRALAFASRWFDEATVRRTFEPLIADWQREWQEATPSRRRWITLRGLAAFVVAILVSSPKILRTAAPSNVTNQIARRMATVVAIIAGLLVVPPTIEFWLRWAAGGSLMRGAGFLFAMPAALAMAFPFAVIAGVDAIRRFHSLPRHVERAAALKLGVFAALLMLVYGGWVVPAANQAVRGVLNPPGMASPLRGMRELTTTELLFDPARATMFAPGTELVSRSASIQRELNGRASMVVMPLALLWMRWCAYSHARGRWYSPLPAWLAIPIAIAAMSAAINSGAWFERDLWAGSRSWMPAIMFVTWGIATSYRRRLLSARA